MAVCDGEPVRGCGVCRGVRRDRRGVRGDRRDGRAQRVGVVADDGRAQLAVHAPLSADHSRGCRARWIKGAWRGVAWRGVAWRAAVAVFAVVSVIDSVNCVAVVSGLRVQSIARVV